MVCAAAVTVAITIPATPAADAIMISCARPWASIANPAMAVVTVAIIAAVAVFAAVTITGVAAAGSVAINIDVAVADDDVAATTIAAICILT